MIAAIHLHLAVSEIFMWFIYVPPTRLLPASISMTESYRSRNGGSFRLLEYSLANVSSLILHNELSHSQAQLEAVLLIISTLQKDWNVGSGD